MTQPETSALADRLMPCPFCGGQAQRLTISEDDEPNNAGGDVICCSQCGASSHVEFGRKENLASRWNTRNQPAPSPDARLAALEAENARLKERLTAIEGKDAVDDENHPNWLSVLKNISEELEDEGDRVYFGSTNDADNFKAVVDGLYITGYPLQFFRRPDLHRHNEELAQEVVRLREQSKTLREAAEPFARASSSEPFLSIRVKSVDVQRLRAVLTEGPSHD